DGELAAEDESPEDEDIAVIDGRVYYTMLRRRQVGALLDCAESGGIAKVYAYVVDTLGYPPGAVTAPRPDLTRRQPPRDGPGRYSRTEWNDSNERHHVDLVTAHAKLRPTLLGWFDGCSCEACGSR